ncbi:hypothetical protein [Micromonospora sp. NPDC005324]|uniref:hypothetical protein n=1 Tax=Micromonospora sp. NPDC005324 TaxID=3157033 RepID=UPI0033B6A583
MTQLARTAQQVAALGENGVDRAGGGVVVRIAIAGRITPEAVNRFADSLDHAVSGGTAFAVLFDRRTMSAPTREGRAALHRWGHHGLPRLVGPCVAWADLYDERRAASIARAAATRAAATPRDGEPDEPPPPYPQRIFTDPGDALGWLHHHLAALV